MKLHLDKNSFPEIISITAQNKGIRGVIVEKDYLGDLCAEDLR